MSKKNPEKTEKRLTPQQQVRALAEKYAGEYLKPQLVKMTKKGDFVVGKLVTVEEQVSKMQVDDKKKKGEEFEEIKYKIYHLEENGELSTGNRGKIAITGSSSLDDQMSQVAVGETVVILNEGKTTTSKGFKANVVTVIKLDVK